MITRSADEQQELRDQRHRHHRHARLPESRAVVAEATESGGGQDDARARSRHRPRTSCGGCGCGRAFEPRTAGSHAVSGEFMKPRTGVRGTRGANARGRRPARRGPSSARCDRRWIVEAYKPDRQQHRAADRRRRWRGARSASIRGIGVAGQQSVEAEEPGRRQTRRGRGPLSRRWPRARVPAPAGRRAAAPGRPRTGPGRSSMPPARRAGRTAAAAGTARRSARRTRTCRRATTVTQVCGDPVNAARSGRRSPSTISPKMSDCSTQIGVGEQQVDASERRQPGQHEPARRDRQRRRGSGRRADRETRRPR